MKYIVGAYVSAPSLVYDSLQDETNFYRNLKEIPQIRGLEIPFWGENINKFGNKFLIDQIDANWENTLTCAPCVNNPILLDENVGLASNNNEARKHALELHKNAYKIFNSINDLFGKNMFLSIQILSSPVNRDNMSSALSFQKSLDEILSWDWGTTDVLVEHCDKYKKPGFDKGFLSIEDELEVIKNFNGSNLGFVLNWGRSVIEAENIDEIYDHINLISSHNLFKGMMFSGTSRKNNLYGPWKDLHMPFGKFKSSLYPATDSELNQKTVETFFANVDLQSLRYIGFKLMTLPHEMATLDKRVGINIDAANILDSYIL